MRHTSAYLILIPLLVSAVAIAEGDVLREMAAKLIYVGKVPESQRGDEVVAARYDTTVIWITENKTRTESGTFCHIYDVVADQLIMLHPKFEIYQLVDRSGRWRASPSDDSLAQDMIMGMMQASDKIEFECVPTDDRDTIMDIPCAKFLVTIKRLDINIENQNWIWFSDQELVPKQALFGAYYDVDYMLGRQSLARCMSSVPGIPLFQRTVSGLGYERRLVSISAEAVPSTFFSIPAGYEEYR